MSIHAYAHAGIVAFTHANARARIVALTHANAHARIVVSIHASAARKNRKVVTALSAPTAECVRISAAPKVTAAAAYAAKN